MGYLNTMKSLLKSIKLCWGILTSPSKTLFSTNYLIHEPFSIANSCIMYKLLIIMRKHDVNVHEKEYLVERIMSETRLDIKNLGFGSPEAPSHII